MSSRSPSASATFATTLHALGTGLNLSADIAMNDVRDLALRSGATIQVVLPPERLRVFADAPAGSA